MMKHGGNIYKTAKKLGCKPEEIVDFSSNINSYHPQIDFKLTDSIVVPYAERSYSELKKTIGTKYGLKKSQISLYNGATSAIYNLLRSLKEKYIYLYAPMYGEYEKAANEANKKIVKIDRFSSIEEEPKQNSIVVFVNPSTPDGKFYNLKKLFKLWKEKKCTVIIDESFLEFEELRSYRDKIESYKKLYIIHSFTKFYSCAGVRIGAVFSNDLNITNLQSPTWSLSSLDTAFLTQRLKDESFHEISVKLHKKNKKELLHILEGSGLFSKIHKSSSNFFLVRSDKSIEIYEHLLKYKILVRTCGSFDFLDYTYLRFAVKDAEAHKLLKSALDDFTKEV